MEGPLLHETAEPVTLKNTSEENSLHIVYGKKYTLLERD
jgi:hypothetical protein